jgi:hypothetical protein
MPNIITSKLRSKNIQHFLENVDIESYYFCFSNPTAWSNENLPDNPMDSESLVRDVYSDMLYAKRISSINCSYVIRNYPWIPNARYQQLNTSEDISLLTKVRTFIRATASITLSGSSVSTSVTITNNGTEYTSTPSVTIDPPPSGTQATAVATVVAGSVVSITITNSGSGYTTAPNITIDPPSSVSVNNFELRPFYIITDEMKVYKCLSNNSGGISSIKPTSTDTITPTTLSDNYVWKYLFTVSISDSQRFYTANWIPVKTLKDDDTSLQWDVQENSNLTRLNSNINNSSTAIGVISNSNINVGDIIQIGDTEQVKVNTLVGATGLTVSRGYSFTTPGATGLNALVRNFSTKSNGSDPIHELGATNIMVKVRVSGSEGNTIVDTNDYRQISILANPIIKGSRYTSQSGSTSTTLRLATTHIAAAGSNTTLPYYPNPGKRVIILNGKGKGQIRNITNYTSPSITVSPAWSVIPDTSSVYGFISNSSVVNQTVVLTLGSVTNGPFVQDSLVTQTNTGASGRVIKFDSTSTPNKIWLSTVTGVFDGANNITSSLVSSTVTGIEEQKLEENTGEVLYIENRKLITRYPDQIEDVKVVISY